MIIYVHILSYMYIYCTYMYMIFVYITPKLYAWAHLVVQVSVILLYSISAQKSVAMSLSPYDFCRDRGTPMLRDQSSPEVLQAFALRDWDSTEIVQEVSRHIIDPSKNVNMVFFYFFTYFYFINCGSFTHCCGHFESLAFVASFDETNWPQCFAPPVV